jgi:hypothetical protein
LTRIFGVGGVAFTTSLGQPYEAPYPLIAVWLAVGVAPVPVLPEVVLELVPQAVSTSVRTETSEMINMSILCLAKLAVYMSVLLLTSFNFLSTD